MQPSSQNDEDVATGQEAPPPFGKRWSRLYAIVLGFLALQIVIFYIFTKAFE